MKSFHPSQISRLPALLVLIASIVLYLALPRGLQLGPSYVIPVLEVVLVIVVALLRPDQQAAHSAHVRTLAIILIALISLANLASVAFLVNGIIGTSGFLSGRRLVYSAASIWLTNVLVFGLWFWEMDAGGPARRASGQSTTPDLGFPQTITPSLSDPGWRPSMIDYLYVALTNATAFSPTDTMPLSRLAKSLMSVESLISMLTVTIVAARAINILH